MQNNNIKALCSDSLINELRREQRAGARLSSGCLQDASPWEFVSGASGGCVVGRGEIRHGEATECGARTCHAVGMVAL